MERTVDKKGRWRSLAVAFRMSPEENEDLNVRVRLSGLTKQEYFIRRINNRDVVVQGSPRVYKALRNQMEEILAELRRLETAGGADDEFLSLLRLVAITVDGMQKDGCDDA
ncbi:hypothetical protein AGMMS49983_15290 [Clostridia bacterium]|nr:hypothetical protein AGMMS49983_15290 [Clostridia bacterium]